MTRVVNFLLAPSKFFFTFPGKMATKCPNFSTNFLLIQGVIGKSVTKIRQDAP